MIGSITLTGIKSIRQAKADLAPLTILIGANGSGKSTVLEGIELIASASAELTRPDTVELQEAENSPKGTWRGRLPADPLRPTRNQGFGAIRGPKPLASVSTRVLDGWSMGVVPMWGTVRLTFPGGMPGAPAYF